MRSKTAKLPGLRVGLVLGGNLVEETLVREPRTITFGQSPRCALSVPIEGVPECWPLFQVVGGDLALCFDDHMTGRYTNGASVQTFDDLRKAGAKRMRGGWVMPLGPTARGKVTVGDATVLFQRVRVSPRPVAALPASVRGTFAERINPMLAAIVAVSVIAHGAAAYWLYNRDVKTKTRLEQISDATREPISADHYVEIIIPADSIPAPTAPGVATVVSGDTGTPDLDPHRVATTRDPGPRKISTTPARDLSDAAIRDIIDNNRALNILTRRGDASSKFGDMNNKYGADDLDRVIRDVNNSGDNVVARSGRDPLRTRDAGDPDIGRTDGPVVDGPTTARPPTPDKTDDTEVDPPEIGPIDPIGPGANPDDIAKTIRRRYLKGIQRCHASTLSRDPSAAGRIDIEITTNAVGQVIEAAVDGFDSGLDSCVEGLARRWRFTPAKEDGKPVEATYLVPFILKAPSR